MESLSSVSQLDLPIKKAAQAIKESHAILITAGAGIGVDSGLPDFRGNEGFWKAYPPFRGKEFAEMANPRWFREDPQVAWGFYGHRKNLYAKVTPHEGFSILKDIALNKPAGYFIFTSNVDGQFQKAGFDEERIVECHGSIHHLQCVQGCENHICPASFKEIVIDEGSGKCFTKGHIFRDIQGERASSEVSAELWSSWSS